LHIRFIIPLLAATALLSADTLTLRDGRTIDGTYLGGDSREVRMAVGDRVQTYDIGAVRRVEFGPTMGAAAPAPTSSSPMPVTPAAPQPVDPPLLRRPEAAPAAAGTAVIPGGTNFVVRLIDSVDSDRDSVGQSYRATVDEPIVVGGKTVIPRGADAVVKLVDDKESGKLAGRTILTLDLMSVNVNGRPLEIDTQEATAQSESRSGRTGKVVGGTAALGAIIGAIAGGGKGAAIGAVSGAGVGAAAQVITKGQQVKIPAESRLTFALRQDLRI
jgi:hypothetical protein